MDNFVYDPKRPQPERLKFIGDYNAYIRNECLNATEALTLPKPTKYKRPPTNDQRGYYRAVILPTIQKYFKREGNFIELDQLDADIKGAISKEFGLIREVENKVTGKVEKRYISLSNGRGTKTEVRMYIEAVLCWAARDHGLDIPSPYNLKEK